MAHYRKLTGGTGKKFAGAGSRYAKSPLQQYTENKLLCYSIYNRSMQRFSAEDQWMEITPALEYRPDLLSYEIYGSPDFWWRIMEMNNMKDIMEFKAGTNIRISGSIF